MDSSGKVTRTTYGILYKNQNFELYDNQHIHYFDNKEFDCSIKFFHPDMPNLKIKMTADNDSKNFNNVRLELMPQYNDINDIKVLLPIEPFDAQIKLGKTPSAYCSTKIEPQHVSQSQQEKRQQKAIVKKSIKRVVGAASLAALAARKSHDSKLPTQQEQAEPQENKNYV